MGAGPAERMSTVETIYQYLTLWLGTTVAVLTLAIVVFGFASFAYFRHVTRITAEATARKTAEAIAERRTNEYLQAELPAILKANRETIYGQADKAEGDEVAEDP